jgi:hypothetical protein
MPFDATNPEQRLTLNEVLEVIPENFRQGEEIPGLLRPFLRRCSRCEKAVRLLQELYEEFNCNEGLYLESDGLTLSTLQVRCGNCQNVGYLLTDEGKLLVKTFLDWKANRLSSEAGV